MSTFQRTFRSKTPAQHALFLQHVANMNFDNPHPSASSDPSINTQSEFNHFYSTSIALLNQFYPEQTITLTTRDPDYITPEIKAKLRRKNRLMRAGRSIGGAYTEGHVATQQDPPQQDRRADGC